MEFPRLEKHGSAAASGRKNPMKILSVMFFTVTVFSAGLSVRGQDSGLYRRNIHKIMERAPREGLWTIKRTDTIRINLVQLSGELKLHKHPDAEHSIFVLSGKIEALIGKDHILLKDGDFVSIPKDMPHKYIVRGKKALIISMDAPYYDPAKTVILE